MEPHSDTLPYKPGDSLICKIVAPEPGGYLVTLVPSGVQGFLPSKDELPIGKVVPTSFICMDGEKALLSYAYMIGTTERVQLSTASDVENAFSVWADSYPRSERLKRAVDLFMPPPNGLSRSAKLNAETAEKFIAQLESDKFTGCVKIDSERHPSRAAALFYKGRAVGAIYTKKSMRDPFPLEASLLLLLEDMRKGDSEIDFYELPDDYVLPLSALFLGVMVEKTDDIGNKEYFENTLADFEKRKTTACLSLQETSPCAVSFILRGEYKGTYSLEKRELSQQREFAITSIESFPHAKLVAVILPDAITSDSMAFGYSLQVPPFALS